MESQILFKCVDIKGVMEAKKEIRPRAGLEELFDALH